MPTNNRLKKPIAAIILSKLKTAKAEAGVAADLELGMLSAWASNTDCHAWAISCNIKVHLGTALILSRPGFWMGQDMTWPKQGSLACI